MSVNGLDGPENQFEPILDKKHPKFVTNEKQEPDIDSEYLQREFRWDLGSEMIIFESISTTFEASFILRPLGQYQKLAMCLKLFHHKQI